MVPPAELPVAAIFLALLAGCGAGESEGPDRFGVSGTVNYEGQPVQSGRIYFEPDSAQGNSGPQGYAEIAAGKYDTAGDSGKGTVGGPHRVRITTPQFEYQKPEAVDLPKEDSTQNFGLKASDVQQTPQSGEEV